MKVILPRFEEQGWQITTAFDLMRKGVRDLQTLTNGNGITGRTMDIGSNSVIEAVLRRILKLERKSSANLSVHQVDDDELPPEAPTLSRQISCGTGTRDALNNLQHLVDQDKYKRILKFLIKVFKNLQCDQSDSSYRNLSKDSDIVMDLVTSYADVVEILYYAGYTTEKTCYTIKTLNRDNIVRTLSVLGEYAARVGLEIII